MLGIDVSKDQLVTALFDRRTGRFQWENRAFPNTEAGIRELLALTPPEAPWIMEPTGRYSILAAQLARAAGRQALLAPPRKAKAYLTSVSTRAKNDPLDGRGLALFGNSRTAEDPLPPYPLKSAAIEQLDQLLCARKGLVQARTQLQQQAQDLVHARPLLAGVLTDLQARLRALDAEIARQTSAQGPVPQAAKLRPVPGIGPVTAAAAASRLVSRNFREADQFVAYIGLDIAVQESGQRKGERGLTKQGDAYLRRLFFLAAIAHVKCKDSPYRELFERHVAQGRPKVAAYNLVARKLARLCWSLIKHDTAYDSARVRQPANPPRATAPAAGTEKPDAPDPQHAAPPRSVSAAPARPGRGSCRRVLRIGSSTGTRPPRPPRDSIN